MKTFVLGSLLSINQYQIVTIPTLFKSNSIIGDTPSSIYVEVINYFGKKGSKILNTAPRLLETGEDFRFVPFRNFNDSFLNRG